MKAPICRRGHQNPRPRKHGDGRVCCAECRDEIAKRYRLKKAAASLPPEQRPDLEAGPSAPRRFSWEPA